MSIVTKTGDKGQTGLFGGKRVSKADLRIRACGAIDELNATLGLILAAGHVGKDTAEKLTHIQNLLFRMGADLATPLESSAKVPRMKLEHTLALDVWVHEVESSLDPLQSFILPGGSEGAAFLHLARTVCRRAEREIVALGETEEISRESIVYINRLSDYLFLLARAQNKFEGVEEPKVVYGD